MANILIFENNFSDENSEEDFEDWESIGLNVSKPPNLLRLFRDFKRHVVPTKATSEKSSQTSQDEERDRLLNLTSSLQVESDGLRRQTAEQQNVIEKLKDELNAASFKFVQLENDFEERIKIQKDVNILDETPELSSSRHISSPIPSEPFCRDSVPQSFFQCIFEKCSPSASPNSSGCVSFEYSLNKVVEVLSVTLPKIVPNVLLAKRDELIPLLLLSIHHDGDDRRRDQLLNLLFNLIKRPDETQRAVIVAGFQKIAENFPERIESELMPQIWGQLTHKYVERRILIAETCSVLLPKVPASLRNSLVYSILNQLISDDRDVQVKFYQALKGCPSFSN